MTQVAVRLDDDEVAAIDRLVAAGRFPSRAAAIRGALARQRRDEGERAIAAAYERGYGGQPVEFPDATGALAGAAIVEFYRDEAPWAAPGPNESG